MSQHGARPRGIVLLSAGRGSRMGAQAQDIPKSMLEVGGKRVLDWLIEAVIARSDGEIVVVTGHGAPAVERHLQERYAGRVASARNERYAEDVNILSTEIGVSALRYPDRGYLIVETDLLLDGPAWDAVFSAIQRDPASFWMCKGRYGPRLTGGIVDARADGSIEAIDYQPVHDARFDGWLKMVGMLAVGPGEVAEDRRLRQAGIAESVSQYYLAPWRSGIHALPCKALRLDGCFAASFNSAEDFASASHAYLARMADPSCNPSTAFPA